MRIATAAVTVAALGLTLTGCQISVGDGAATPDAVVSTASNTSSETNVVADVSPSGESSSEADGTADAGAAGSSAASEASDYKGVASGTLTITEGETGTWDCNGADVEITGSLNTVVLTGTCGKVSIAGDTNTVTADTIQDLAVDGEIITVTADTIETISKCGGSINTITWQKGVKASDVDYDGSIITLTGP